MGRDVTLYPQEASKTELKAYIEGLGFVRCTTLIPRPNATRGPPHWNRGIGRSKSRLTVLWYILTNGLTIRSCVKLPLIRRVPLFPGCIISQLPLRTHNLSQGMWESVSHFLAAKIGDDCIGADVQDACGVANPTGIHRHVDDLLVHRRRLPSITLVQQEGAPGTALLAAPVPLLALTG